MKVIKYSTTKYSTITSSANPRIKEAIRLQVGKNRRRERRFLIDGVRETVRAFDSGYTILDVFVLEEPQQSQKGLLHEGMNDVDSKRAEKTLLLETLAQKNVPIWTLPLPLFEKIALGDRGEGEGLIAVVQTPNTCWNEEQIPNDPFFAVVEQVEKPGNLGAIFRSADGAGINGLLIADPLCDVYNPNTIRSSLGTVFRIPSQWGSSEQMLEYLRSRKVRIAAALCDGSIPYTDFDFRGPVAIVLGSEARGLSPVWREPDITPIRLPMLGIADSLNVSNAAAILFYEALRQREGGGR